MPSRPLFAAALLVALAACRSEPSIVIRFEPQDLTMAPEPPRPRRVLVVDAAAAPPARDAAAAGMAQPIAGATDGGPPRGEAADCARDVDCATARADCCGCAAGGKATALPRRGVAAHEAALRARCEGVMCVQMMSNDPSCARVAACRGGRCALVDAK